MSGALAAGLTLATVHHEQEQSGSQLARSHHQWEPPLAFVGVAGNFQITAPNRNTSDARHSVKDMFPISPLLKSTRQGRDKISYYLDGCKRTGTPGKSLIIASGASYPLRVGA